MVGREGQTFSNRVSTVSEYQNFPNSYLLFTKVSMHLSISHSLCSAVHNYDSLCRRSSRSPIMLSILLVGRAGASPPSRTAAIIFLYILYISDRPFWPPGGPALRANVAGQITRASTCIHMYTYVYTWSRLAYCETTTPAMEMTREATERLQKRQERLRKRQEGPADPRFRQQRLRKLSLRQRSRSPLSESQQRRDDRLSRRRERERKRRLRKQQRNERYAWGKRQS